MIVSSAILPTLVILFSLKLVAPRLTVPVAVKLSAPISIAPNPLVILPLFKAPVPVILAWCCVTAPTAILAFGTVPLSMLLPAILPVKLLACTAPATPNPPAILTAPVIVLLAAVVSETVITPVTVKSSLTVVVLIALPMLITLAAPPIFTVVALVLTRLNVPVELVVISAPLTARSPSSVTVAFLIFRSPVVAPMLISVPAPNALIIVALLLIRLNAPVTLVVISPPSTFKSRSISTIFLNLVVPLAAPINISVAAPPMFSVVAVVLIRLNVAALVVISPPSTFKSRSTSRLFLTLVVPVAAPTLRAVAAPAKLIVVAFVLNSANVAVAVVILVVIFGFVPNTNAPLPVSSLITPASSALVVAAN